MRWLWKILDNTNGKVMLVMYTKEVESYTRNPAFSLDIIYLSFVPFGIPLFQLIKINYILKTLNSRNLHSKET